MINIVINGQTKKIPKETTIASLKDTLGLKVEIMAVAVNMEIVKKENWDNFTFSENDKVEFLQFVGGG